MHLDRDYYRDGVIILAVTASHLQPAAVVMVTPARSVIKEKQWHSRRPKEQRY